MALAPADALLCRARAGDSRAFARLCDLHRKRVWNVVASVTRKSADTDDLAQDALLRAWAALPGFRGESAVFGAWLCRIALNAAHDWQKSAWRRRVLVGLSSGNGDGDSKVCPDVCAPGPHEETLRRETARSVRAAVLRLAPKERVPIWLVYFEEFSLAEVARMENVPESTVRSRIKKGLSRLQKPLQDFGFAELGETDKLLWGAAPPAAANAAFTRGEAEGASPIAPDWKGCIA